MWQQFVGDVKTINSWPVAKLKFWRLWGPPETLGPCSNRNRDATGDANHSSYLWLKEMTQHGSVHRGLGHKGFTNESTFLHLRVSSHDSRPAEADKSKIYQKTCLSQLVPLHQSKNLLGLDVLKGVKGPWNQALQLPHLGNS